MLKSSLFAYGPVFNAEEPPLGWLECLGKELGLLLSDGPTIEKSIAKAPPEARAARRRRR